MVDRLVFKCYNFSKFIVSKATLHSVECYIHSRQLFDAEHIKKNTRSMCCNRMYCNMSVVARRFIMVDGKLA
jgi:hypothetical protein